MNKSKCQITRMERKEKSLGFKTRDTWVQIPAPPLTHYRTWGYRPNLCLRYLCKMG